MLIFFPVDSTAVFVPLISVVFLCPSFGAVPELFIFHFLFYSKVQLKHILSLVVRQRKGFKLREKRFMYAAGIGVKNPYYKMISGSLDPTSER